MVIDASRVPAVGTSRSRLARPATVTHIPSATVRRVSPSQIPSSPSAELQPSSMLPSSRRLARLTDDSSNTPSRPQSSIPTTRRFPAPSSINRPSESDHASPVPRRRPLQSDRSDLGPISKTPTHTRSRALRSSGNESRIGTGIPTPRRQLGARTPGSPSVTVRRELKNAPKSTSGPKVPATATPGLSTIRRKEERPVSSIQNPASSSLRRTPVRRAPRSSLPENQRPRASFDTLPKSSISHRTSITSSRTPTNSGANSTSMLSNTSAGASSRTSGVPRPDGRSLSHGVPRTPTSRITRPALKESPYLRRSSAGGPAATRDKSTAPVTRRLNLAPDTDEFTPSSAFATPGTFGVSVSNSIRRGSLTRAPDRPVDNTECRMSGANTPRSRRGSNVAESFRDFRRASLDNASSGDNHPDVESDNQTFVASEQLDCELTASSEVESLHAMRRASMDNEHFEQDRSIADAAIPRSMSLVDESAHSKTLLPDRVDPMTPTFPLHSTSSQTARKPMRFSDAAVYLGDVDRMRDSLGSRRSVDVNDPRFDLETPRLRRSSIGMNGIVFGAYEEPLDQQPGEQRSPLTSIAHNQENVAPMDRYSPSRSSGIEQAFSNKAFLTSAGDKYRATSGRIPGIDDDHLDLGIDEEVEDLGAN